MKASDAFSQHKALAQVAPSAALPEVEDALSANAANKLAGQQLLQQLPWWQKMQARLQSYSLLLLIYATFWPALAATLLLSWCLPLLGLPAAALNSSSTAGHAHSNGVGGDGTSQPRVALSNSRPGTVMVTGGKMTKALHVCRHLAAAGWRVVLVETHKYWHVGSRFSSSVAAFHTVPVPEDEPEAYVNALLGMLALVVACTLAPAALDLLVPKHHVVTSPQQLQELNSEKELGSGRRFVLKSISYDSVHRADLMLLPCSPAKLSAYLARPDISITQQCPWILQEFIQLLTRYAVLRRACAGHPAIREWVQAFVQRTNSSGQLCFDFIESSADGRLYCIECNPRTSSVITEFHDSTQLEAAFAIPEAVNQTVTPLPGSRPVYWWWNEVARLTSSPWSYWAAFLSVVSTGVDGVFTARDPWPFIALHYLQVPLLLAGNMLRGNPWKKVDLCIGKVAELYGD
ncbi:hypothetical protein COO60DRAFT_1457169 [Scenedesmus sp. NREL 46B-D3]|nr:hypothetical protein COO60DRAFT_1457169 [Scenedesmus sp. NREL 46B-D3]